MLKMIKILKDEKIHNMKDIAEKIEISTIMVKKYKNELEQAGIYIESKRGINGGYSLNKELNNIDIGLTYQELIKLKEIEQYFNDDQDFKKIIGKIIESYEKNINEADLKKINRIQELGKSNLKDIYLSLRKAINKKNKVKIKYYSNDSGLNDRVIHPSEMFYYLEEWYVAAFCEKRNSIRLFKLNNIQEYEILDDKYEKFELKK